MVKLIAWIQYQYYDPNLRSCHSHLLSNIKTNTSDIVIEYSLLALQMEARITNENATKISYNLANGRAIRIAMAYPLAKSTSCPVI
jgi:hypothetical protein